MDSIERLGIDIAALAVIVAEMNPAISGLAIHEWLGVLLVVPLAVHMVLNWSWVTGAVGRFSEKPRRGTRLNLIVDIGLFLSAVAAGVSGVLLIPGFAAALAVPVSPLWHAVHLAASNLTFVFCVIHAALHVRWMFDTVRRLFAPREKAVLGRTPRGVSASRLAATRTVATVSESSASSEGA